VSVGIAKASPVEEAKVVRVVCGQGASCEGAVGQFVDTFSAVDLQLKDGLARPGGVGDLSLRDGGELRFLYEEYVDVVADDDGPRGLVRELFVVGEAELDRAEAGLNGG
jgi:hypothetical protein